MYPRLLRKQLLKNFFQGKVLIVVGARQTGKTTLAMEIIDKFKGRKKIKIFNCDNPTDRGLLNNRDIEFLSKVVGGYDIVLIDEGQKIKTAGQSMKLLVDHYKKEKQFIVTGSSSFNLLEKTEEALTGRKFVFHLFPLSLEEINPEKDILAGLKELNDVLVYGSYPEVASQGSFEKKMELLQEITSSYLFKDILEFQQLKNSNLVDTMLKALAFQIGSEVSYNELSKLLEVNKKTVERYINLLEKNFIIFRVSPYSRNKRREIAKLKKIYFYDLGIRNALINNFNPLSDRNDVGALWENFIISERIKYQAYHNVYSNNYFWRTYDGSEVDWIEERDGKLYGYEIKWKENKRITAPPKWKEYANSEYKIISPEKINNFIL